jgi:hypothetical protein
MCFEYLNLTFEKELEKFEGLFARDEILDI